MTLLKTVFWSHPKIALQEIGVSIHSGWKPVILKRCAPIHIRMPLSYLYNPLIVLNQNLLHEKSDKIKYFMPDFAKKVFRLTLK